MFGFSGDFLTALSILIPQIENAVRYLAVECGELVYNMNEEGIEEIFVQNLDLTCATMWHMECWMIRHSRALKLCISGGLH